METFVYNLIPFLILPIFFLVHVSQLQVGRWIARKETDENGRKAKGQTVKSIFLTAVLAISLPATAAFASDSDGAETIARNIILASEECSVEPDQKERLSCYDELYISGQELLSSEVRKQTYKINAGVACTHAYSEMARLDCYDEQFDSPESRRAQFGRWVVHIDSSVMTDQKSVFARIESLEPVPSQYNGSDSPARVTLRCLENTTSVIITMNDNFLADIQGYGKVEYRIDRGKLNSVRMKESTDNKALGLWKGRQAIPFIKRLIGSQELILRITPYSQSPVIVTFPIEQVENAVQELRQECGW